MKNLRNHKLTFYQVVSATEVVAAVAVVLHVDEAPLAAVAEAAQAQGEERRFVHANPMPAIGTTN
jgi:hypothetical protein